MRNQITASTAVIRRAVLLAIQETWLEVWLLWSARAAQRSWSFLTFHVFPFRVKNNRSSNFWQNKKFNHPMLTPQKTKTWNPPKNHGFPKRRNLRFHRDVDLALNQAAKPWKLTNIRSIGTICGGLFPKMYGGQISNRVPWNLELKRFHVGF